MPQQPAEKLSAADAADLGRRICSKFLRRSGCGRRDCQIAERLVWAMFIIKLNEYLADVIHVAQTEAQEVIECLAL